jgi:hypothetical protein
MGKKTPYFRTTISVPRHLKRRMDAVTESVNWSALACRAFEDKLAEIATNKEEKTMIAIIQRLRASNPDVFYQQGQDEGRRWASEQAKCDDLLRLERFHDRKRASGEWETYFDRPDGLLYRKEFWRSIVGKDAFSDHHHAWFRGFAEGALALWLEVKDRL